jgi:hypothetical protein
MGCGWGLAPRLKEANMVKREMKRWRTHARSIGAWLAAGCAATALILILQAPASAQVPNQNPIVPNFGLPRVHPRPEQKPEENPTPGRVSMLLWFDTEDYILPQSDDAAKRLAIFLTQQGVSATFKVVGEKARTLERRSRQDVIGALERHDIGYHSNTHSQHPTVAEYESTLDWDSGVEEFTRRERPGFDDVARIFGKTPAAYGQPGVSWAPQAFPALLKWGVRVYLDEGKQVGLKGRPFWYGGLLNIFNTQEGEQLRPDESWSNLDMAKAKFQDFYFRMTSRKEGGVISLPFHPCEFVHKEFWDAVNFREGANPPPDAWQLPPLKTPEESERAFKYLEDLVVFMKSFPRVDFITASQAAQMFRDQAQKHVFSTQDIVGFAGQVDPEVTFQAGERYSLSASEVFYLLNKFVASLLRRKGAEPLILEGTPFGPAAAPVPLSAKLEVPWPQMARTVLDVQDELEKTGRIPSAVWMGSQPIPPESYLVGLAQLTVKLTDKGEPPDSVSFAPARLAAADYVADDSPELWDWVIFPRGFHAPKLMSLAKLQAWTLKPARK